MVEKVIIRPATADDLQPLRTFVTDVFVANEKMSAHIELSPHAFMSLYDELTRYIDLDMSLIACTPSEGIVACMLCGPYNAPVDVDRIHLDSGPLLTVVEVLDGWFDAKFADFPKDKIVHLILGAVNDQYRNTGVGRRLGVAGLKRAAEVGWRMMVVECTSSAPQHLMRDGLGFTAGKEVMYEDVERDGKRPFAGLDGSAMLLYKHLGRPAKL